MSAPLKITTVIGARPQIIKAAALSRAIRDEFAGRIKETLVHTGQHYDQEMSQVFFDELGIPAADLHLSGTDHGQGVDLAQMIEGLDRALRAERPDLVLVYGDTTSTMAATIAAGKLNIPIAHVEAGLRSYDRSMPEELNRVVCDHCSTWLFCPTENAVQNLKREGFDTEYTGDATPDTPKVIFAGDVMYDNSLHFSPIAEQKSKVIEDLSLVEKGFALFTVHRANNTDSPERLKAILAGMFRIQKELGLPIILPLHPRTRNRIEEVLPAELSKKLHNTKGIHVTPPVGFLDMIQLERHASVVLTDSGGVQKEAYYFGTPVVVLRDRTEWVEIVDAGRAVLSEADPERMVAATDQMLKLSEQPMESLFGDGHAAVRICMELLG